MTFYDYIHNLEPILFSKYIMFQENIGLVREKRDLPTTYQREMDKKGIGNTYDDFKVSVIIEITL